MTGRAEQHDFLHAALVDLAAAADCQAAYAAEADSVTASSALFLLADQLRAAAALIRTVDATHTDPGDPGEALVVTGTAPRPLQPTGG